VKNYHATKKAFTSVLLFSLSFTPALSQAGETIFYDGSNATLLKTVGGVPSSLAPQDLNNLSGNTIIVDIGSGGTNIAGSVFGGFSGAANDVTNNTVRFSAGTVNRDVYGGFSTNGSATGNTVIIDGGTVNRDVYGGFSTNGSATGNTVIIDGGTVNRGVYGGFSTNGSATGNTVNISGGTVNISVYGSSANGNATANTVNLSGGSIGSDLYGGYSTNGNATGNTVNISGGIVGGNVYAGYSRSSATNNSVHISSGEVTSGIYGGSGSTGSMNNTVDISGGTVKIDVDGGFSSNGSATSNSVYLSGGTVLGSIYGGYGASATGNIVNLSGGTVSLSVYGGNSVGSGTVTANTVNLSGGTVNRDVYGGFSTNGNATNNTVNLISGTVNRDVYGGFSTNGSATGNIVNLSGGTVGTGVYGGYSTNGSATGNTVNLSGGTVGAIVYGGYSTNGSATGNTVNLSGGTVGPVIGGDVAGGVAGSNATGNTVNISGGTITEVYGGINYSLNGDAISNTVNLSGGTVDGVLIGGDSVHNATGNTVNLSGGTVNGDVYGGRSGSGDATNNTVNLFSGAKVGGIMYGGGSVNGGSVWGNTLNVQAFQGSVNSLANFDHYNFLLPNTLENGDTQVNVTGAAVNLGGTAVAITGIEEGGALLQAGDTLTLINKTTNTPATFSGENVPKGISLIYDFVQVQNPDALIVKVLDVEANPQAKALAEGQLADIAFLNQGADQLADMSRTVAANNPRKGLIPFGSMHEGSDHYNTGSRVNLNGPSFLVGFARMMEVAGNPLALGPFAEAGWGNYDSNNSFNNAASVTGNGNTHYYGGGLLSRYDFARGVYVDAALRVGQVHSDFNSTDLCEPGFGCAQYDTASLYYGAQAGLGYVMPVHEKLALDVSTRYLWTHQNQDSVTVVNDPIDFAAIDSQRWRGALRLNYLAPSAISPYVGLAYEYEFDGQANAKAYDLYQIEAPSLKGGTGIGELGVNILRNMHNNQASMKLNLGLQAYTGQHEGVGGTVGFRYAY
jgi:hypothetical protein